MLKKCIGMTGAAMALYIGGVCFLGCERPLGAVGTAKVQEAYDQFANWTPENIAKNPQLYLKFCESETNKAIEKMKASKISLQRKKAGIAKPLEDCSAKALVGKKSLDQLKTLYREAAGDGGSGFPVKWLNKEMSEDVVKKQILRTAGEVQSQEKLRAMYEKAIAQLSKAERDLEQQQEKAKEQLANISVSMETLKIQDISNELAGQLADMGGMLAGIVDFETEDPDQLVSLDDISSVSESVVDDSKFDEIMGK